MRLESQLHPLGRNQYDSPDVLHAYHGFLKVRTDLLVKALNDMCNCGDPHSS